MTDLTLRIKLLEKAEFSSVTLQLYLWAEQYSRNPDNRRNGGTGGVGQQKWKKDSACFSASWHQEGML